MLFIFAVALSCGALRSANAESQVPVAADDIRRELAAVQMPESARATVRAIYQAAEDGPLWTTAARRLQLREVLTGIESEGLEAGFADTLPSPKLSWNAHTDVNATLALLRAAELVRHGAVDPESLPSWEIHADAQPAAPLVANAIRDNQLVALFQTLRPTADAYEKLRTAYRHYRGLIGSEDWTPLATAPEVILNSSDVRLAQVQRRLILLGDLIEDAPDASLSVAVKRFQSRHGLIVDGRIGPATLAAINVTPAARADQLAANMEYWRLLPRQWPSRYVAVNAAAAALDIIENGQVTYAARVIVGDPGHPTPVMAATITAVTFNPDWTIPRSIAIKEILPKLRRQADYLKRHNIIIRDRTPDEFGLDLNWRAYTRSNFPFTLRQLPGANNALGLVKFEMPNRFDVYLHDTPERGLFDRPVRTLSHGCVRVQCPEELARRLIGSPSIGLDSPLADIASSAKTLTVPLPKPLPVYLLYFTAFVSDDGAVNFRADVYGRDSIVLKQLRKGSGDNIEGQPPSPIGPR